VGGADKDILRRDGWDFSTYFVAEDAGEAKEVGAANCHTSATVFDDHGADGKPAECPGCWFRRSNAARDGQKRVWGDIANGNGDTELGAGCRGKH
jgi:hypothetical protein